MSNFSTGENESVRVFNEKEARRIAAEIASYMLPERSLYIMVSSWWGAGQRWARNRASLTSDQREISIIVGRGRAGRVERGSFYLNATTNQLDSVSLKGIAQHIELYAKRSDNKMPPDMIVDVPRSDVKGANVWSDETFNRSVVENATAVEELTRLSENDQLMSSGYLETTGSGSLEYIRDNWGRVESQWGLVTQAVCSATVRHPKGTASGWAGKTSFDMNRVDVSEVAKIAFEKCKKSLDPVRIEPGRYQVILEPQATAGLIDVLISGLARRIPEEMGRGAMFLGIDNAIRRFRTKLGLKIVDERINVFHDPADPIVGSHFAPLHGRRDFIKNGVLTGLFNDYQHNLNEISEGLPLYRSSSYTLNGGNTTFSDMISSTKRGLIVSRFTQIQVIDPDSVLSGGLTRDGLWLVENGAITKAVRNFRWTESPLFALNNVEQIGIEEQVFDPVSSRNPFANDSFALSLNNVVVPPLKINDFSFTSTIDAI